MKYVRGSTLLPFFSEEIRAVPCVPRQRLPSVDLLVYDGGVSDFYFEFEPEEDIERFLQHAHLGCRAGNRLLACREDLQQILVPRGPGERPPVVLAIPPGGELPAPLRFVPQQPAFEAIGHEGRWRGMITCCSCGIAGCFSQYAVVERGLCL